MHLNLEKLGKLEKDKADSDSIVPAKSTDKADSGSTVPAKADSDNTVHGKSSSDTPTASGTVNTDSTVTPSNTDSTVTSEPSIALLSQRLLITETNSA